MLGLLSLSINGILALFIGYHLLKYSKGETPMVIVGVVYALIVALCMLTLLTHTSL